jgi:hypothetical protein
MQEDNVYDLAAWRARRRPPACRRSGRRGWTSSRLYDALEAQGFELRFELPEAGGRVTCELRSHDGEAGARVVALRGRRGAGAARRRAAAA